MGSAKRLCLTAKLKPTAPIYVLAVTMGSTWCQDYAFTTIPIANDMSVRTHRKFAQNAYQGITYPVTNASSKAQAVSITAVFVLVVGARSPTTATLKLAIFPVVLP